MELFAKIVQKIYKNSENSSSVPISDFEQVSVCWV